MCAKLTHHHTHPDRWKQQQQQQPKKRAFHVIKRETKQGLMDVEKKNLFPQAVSCSPPRHGGRTNPSASMYYYALRFLTRFFSDFHMGRKRKSRPISEGKGLKNRAMKKIAKIFLRFASSGIRKRISHWWSRPTDTTTRWGLVMSSLASSSAQPYH